MTTEPFRITTDDQCQLIDRMRQLAARRIEREATLRADLERRTEQAQLEYAEQRDNTISSYERQFLQLVADFRNDRETCFARCVEAAFTLYEEEQQLEGIAARERDQVVEDASTLRSHKQQRSGTEFRERSLALKQEFEQFASLWGKRQHEFEAMLAEAKRIVTRRLPWPAEPPPAGAPAGHLPKQQHLERYQVALQHAHEALHVVQQQPAARFVEDGWPILLAIFSLVPLGYVLWLFMHSLGVFPVAGATLLLSSLTGVLIWFIARPISASQTQSALPPLCHALKVAETELKAAEAAMQGDRQRSEAELARLQEMDAAYAQAAWDKVMQEQMRVFQHKLEQGTLGFVQRRAKIESDYQQQSHQIAEKYPREIQKLEHAFDQRLQTLHREYMARLAAERETLVRQTAELQREWDTSWSAFQLRVREMNGYCDEFNPAWDNLSGTHVSTSRAPTGVHPFTTLYPVALRFGRYRFDCREGHDAAASTLTDADVLEFPAVLSYPESPSLLFEAEGEGRDVAIESMRDIMLRLLTSFPPGKVRFTIFDPVGLGQNFSAFMHLADFDERLVANRIWTESGHINQKLADLTEHMENVIQKYLRNEFSSIQEYNDQAGEVAEPFQILVVANFPANFSDEAARRLVSIASSGARCGVYTLISTDGKLKLPRNFDLADLETQSTTLLWNAGANCFEWQRAEIRPLALELEKPPAGEPFTHLVRSIGQLSKEASRVEVPFEAVLPQPGQWWTGDSREGIDVPLGRAGAKKLQYMRLGRGTSQHVLISGKTGSGKSTLLNCIITNLAAYYSPLELEFYLIDFKKGVEFKAYATQQLPHARVIAIESEREFGLSVLERLDAELKSRGDLFRSVGVQDVKGYRHVVPEAIMPRILLIIDEFQEFFTSEDKISHDAGLLLDRLVRQGRAFGIHVLLGSQTLAGAYSLARSTLGQMAVRIALQCSESDAHLILSEDNTAARLLSRPGEAIYNDANGLFEGNHPFQVVWLSDTQREKYLQQSASMAAQRELRLPRQTVFEGNVAANPAENTLLVRALAAGPASETAVPQAWLGAAVAIKDPTAAPFRRQGGANLLVVGQQEEMALGTLHAALVSLATLSLDSDPAVTGNDVLAPLMILDGSRSDGPDADFWRGPAGSVLPGAKVFGQRDVPSIIQQLAAEVERRTAEGDTGAAPLFLCVYNLARFRELKKSDDFGVSSFSDDDSPQLDRQFNAILRDGPACGIHSLVWCDSCNNLSRWLERSALREFDMRVLFQMSVTDSSNLMDHPSASRLGARMALLFSEETGTAEKFRPYGLPESTWLKHLEKQFRSPRATPAANS